MITRSESEDWTFLWLTLHFFHCFFFLIVFCWISWFWEPVIAVSEVDLHYDLSAKCCSLSKTCYGRLFRKAWLEWARSLTFRKHFPQVLHYSWMFLQGSSLCDGQPAGVQPLPSKTVPNVAPIHYWESVFKPWPLEVLRFRALKQLGH